MWFEKYPIYVRGEEFIKGLKSEKVRINSSILTGTMKQSKLVCIRIGERDGTEYE